MIKKLKAAGLGYNVDDDKAIDKFGKSEKEAISLKLSSALIRLSFEVRGSLMQIFKTSICFMMLLSITCRTVSSRDPNNQAL